MRRIPPFKAFALAAALLLPLSAMAHKVKVFAAPDGNKVSGKVYFSGGGKGAALEVQVLGKDGAKVDSVRTDGEGAFVYVPKSQGDFTFIVDSGDGHTAKASVSMSGAPAVKEVAAAQTQAPSDSKTLESFISQEISKQILPLREQLDHYEEQVRLRDIVGGVGWIMGVAGLAAWFMSRRKKS